MYSGSDLLDVVEALDDLCADGFLEYDLNAGQVVPYLSINVSRSHVAAFPGLSMLPLGQVLVRLYQSSDFSMPAADFIVAFQDGVKAKVAANASVLAAVSAQFASWGAFASSYAAKGV